MKQWGLTQWRLVWADTLSKRLFVLLWATLVLSHLLGFWLATGGGLGPGGHGQFAHAPAGLLMPSMPPGLIGGPRPGDRPPPDFHGGPPPMLWLDYLARFAVMGLAAWLGARWLTAPMRKLATASQGLGRAVGHGGALPLLDASQGPQEVRQTAQVFNDMARGLQDQFAQRSLMMAAVSHDLRTPLTRLRLRLEKLLPDPTAERCVADVQDINAMIDAVLDAMNEERRQEAVKCVDVLAMVQAMADDLQDTGEAACATGVPAIVRVQPVAFKRVLSNLISNALRYGHRADVQVSLMAPAAGQAQPQVRITIDDAGPGIAPDLMASVFKPFVRLDASRSRDTGGVGLGLYIARELAQRNGASVCLSNRPEGGLRAELVLPAVAG